MTCDIIANLLMPSVQPKIDNSRLDYTERNNIIA